MTLTINHKGLAPHLEEIFGKGAFDQGENQGGKAPLETFLNSKTQDSEHFKESVRRSKKYDEGGRRSSMQMGRRKYG